VGHVERTGTLVKSYGNSLPGQWQFSPLPPSRRPDRKGADDIRHEFRSMMVTLNKYIISLGRHFLTMNFRGRELTQLAIAISSLTGVLLVIVITAMYGVAVSPDSLAYLSAAKSLLEGEGFINSGGGLYINWPPLFPMILAAPGSLGIDGVTAARFINAFAFGGIVFGAGQLFRAQLRSNLLVIVGTVSILLSPVLLRISIKVWSEPLFTLFAVLFVFFLARFINEKRMTFLLIITILAGLATLQRYIGVTLILAGWVSIAFAMRKVDLQARVRYLILFGLFSVIPIGVWIGRNYALTSTLTGGRNNAYHTIPSSVNYTAETLVSWLIPYSVPFAAALVIGLVSWLALISIVVWVQLKHEKKLNFRLAKLWPVVSFLLIYLFVLILISPRVFDRVEFRLLSPLYIVFILLWLIALEAAARSLNRIGKGNILGNILVAGAVTLWVASLAGQFLSLDLRQQAVTVATVLKSDALSMVPSIG
jgi:hypothetical protein